MSPRAVAVAGPAATFSHSANVHYAERHGARTRERERNRRVRGCGLAADSGGTQQRCHAHDHDAGDHASHRGRATDNTTYHAGPDGPSGTQCLEVWIAAAIGEPGPAKRDVA